MNKKNLFLALSLGFLLVGPSLATPNTRKITNKVGRLEKKGEKVNINNADAKILQSVKGIGPKKANAILEYRQKNGKFNQITDLLKINQKGINQKWLEKIKGQLTCH